MHPRPPTFSLFPYTTLFRSDALDLCLACKGCKADCPMNVDMATYKAEFLSHYYKHRLRPIHAYAFGLIHLWAQLAQFSPRLINFVNHAPVTSSLIKGLIGIASQRQVPMFASQSFKAWFRRNRPDSMVGTARRAVPTGAPEARPARSGRVLPNNRVILWP